jgi:hypothetical protein
MASPIAPPAPAAAAPVPGAAVWRIEQVIYTI